MLVVTWARAASPGFGAALANRDHIGSAVAAEALVWTSRHPTTPWTVTDRAAVDACLRFANDHRILVEPACGAALATVCDNATVLSGLEPVLVILCGGAGASLERAVRRAAGEIIREDG